ncbi:hypothetical protein PR202_ga18213 [Eleusine coracana subsp. coracana]|uniref:RING-type E3 ubiquitin transferase n=1 Tax=Eleusine coracana subsp. coracana TaxID=191504 RepID=A0AAV5CRH4_ELECO|nr:hypothetical protein PR202_ga18213 [Eleusine coracana subsp. coracana]
MAEIEETVGDGAEMEAPVYSTVAVAVNGSRSSRYALKWALDKFVPEGRILFRILHVRPTITMVPTPSERFTFLLSLTDSIYTFLKLKGSKTATKISDCIPSFCTAYIVSKGKLSFVRSATSDSHETPKSISSSTVSSPSSRSLSSSAPSEWGDTYGASNILVHQSSLPLQRDQALAIINKLPNRIASPSGSVTSEVSYNDDPALISSHSIEPEKHSSSCSSGNSIYKSFQRDNLPDNSDQGSVSDISKHDQDDLRFHIEKLRVKLQHLHKLHDVTQHQSCDAIQNIHNLGAQRVEDEIICKEIELTEDMVRRLVRKQEMEEYKKAREAGFKQCSDEMEVIRSSDDQEANVNETEKRIARHCFGEYSRYTWEEIQASTSWFSADLMIGKGSYGTVYKAKLRHTVAAVKILNSPEGCGIQQLQQEVLSFFLVRCT